MPSSVKWNFEQFRRDVERFKGEVGDKAIRQAENAAARVAKYAAQTAAPVGETGVLRKSISIARTKTKKLALAEGEQERAVRVGPSRRGYYGYFLEHGYRAAGSRRIKRTATRITHSQSGTTSFNVIRGKKWFSTAIERAENQIIEAGRRAIEQTVKRAAR